MNPSLLIPIVAIVFGCSIGLLTIILDYKKRRDLLMLHHKERLLAIERGLEVPPLPESLLSESCSEGPPLQSGLKWLFVGLGLMFALYFAFPHERYFAFATIPLAAGIAQLLYHFIKSDNASGKSTSTPPEPSSSKSLLES